MAEPIRLPAAGTMGDTKTGCGGRKGRGPMTVSQEIQGDSGKPVRGPALSPRLQMVARLIPDGQRLIDIGTDHAYLPIHAVLGGRFQEAVAADVRPGPLEKASCNIERFGCLGRICTAQADGLQGFSLQDGDVVVMAGLGGLEMVDILREAPFSWPRLVLQPQKSASDLRRHLAQNGYVIRQETLSLDGARLYLGIAAEYAPAESAAAPVDPVDLYIGPALRREQPPLFEHYLLRERILVTRAMLRQPLLASVRQAIDQLLAAMGSAALPEEPAERMNHAAF